MDAEAEDEDENDSEEGEEDEILHVREDANHSQEAHREDPNNG